MDHGTRALLIVSLTASIACGSSTPSAPATNNPPAVQPVVIPSDVSLTAPMIQVFVDRAPAANKTQVSQKLGQVTF